MLFEFTCYFSLHIILLGGVILQKRIKDTDFESRVHAVSSSAVTHHPSLACYWAVPYPQKDPLPCTSLLRSGVG